MLQLHGTFNHITFLNLEIDMNIWSYILTFSRQWQVYVSLNSIFLIESGNHKQRLQTYLSVQLPAVSLDYLQAEDFIESEKNICKHTEI